MGSVHDLTLTSTAAPINSSFKSNKANTPQPNAVTDKSI